MNKAIIINEQFFSEKDYVANINKIKQLKAISLTLKDLGEAINYRQLVYWYNEGILISDPNRDKLNKLDFIDYCWIQMVSIMRAFGMSIDSIKQVKEALLDGIDWLLLLDSIEPVNNLLEQIPLKDREKFIEAMLSIKKSNDKAKEDSSVFFICIIDFIFARKPISFLINANNKVAILKGGEYEVYTKNKAFNEFMNSSYLKISLSEIIWKFLESSSFEIKDKHLEILNENEQKILTAVRSDGLKEIKIRFKDNEPIMLEVTKINKVERSSRLLELIKAGAYQDISIITQDGNIVNCENTIKQKLDSRTS